MRVAVALYGAALVVIGQPVVEVTFDTSSATLGQVLQRLIALYPRARPYLLDEAGRPPSFVRVLINNVRPEPDATMATVLQDEDRVAMLVAVAGGGDSRSDALPQKTAKDGDTQCLSGNFMSGNMIVLWAVCSSLRKQPITEVSSFRSRNSHMDLSDQANP